MVKNLFFRRDKSPKNVQIKKDILTHFMSNGNDTISEVSKVLDLSVPTITKFITELMDQDLIKEFGKAHTPGGRHPIVYGLSPESAYFVGVDITRQDRKSTRLNSSHVRISYAVFCLKKKNK